MIMAAPRPMRAVKYDPIREEIVLEIADLIGLIEMDDPEQPDLVSVIPLLMSMDEMGGYILPQFDITFLEFIDMKADIDYGKYQDQILHIKAELAQLNANIVEVETKGNISQIKTFVRKPKKDKPDYEN